VLLLLTNFQSVRTLYTLCTRLFLGIEQLFLYGEEECVCWPVML
jgi:hypothetical protein